MGIKPDQNWIDDDTVSSSSSSKTNSNNGGSGNTVHLQYSSNDWQF